MAFGAMLGLVAKVCDAALADGTAREPADVVEALAIDHIARERAAALLV